MGPESLHLTLVGQVAACPQDEVVGGELWPATVEPAGSEPGPAAGRGLQLRQAVRKTCKCPCASANTKGFYKYTKMTGKGKNKKPVANAQCLFDPTMGKKCGKCIKGGKQCGPPMHKWCQNPNSKVGCKGIPNYKYTLSTRGAPCFNNPEDKSCPICKNNKMKQCGISKIAGKCGKFCAPMKDRKCDGNRFDCTQIDLCGPGASCAVNNKAKSGNCKCDEGLRGDGINCFYQNGTVAESAKEVITMSMNTKTQFFVYTQDEL